MTQKFEHSRSQAYKDALQGPPGPVPRPQEGEKRLQEGLKPLQEEPRRAQEAQNRERKPRFGEGTSRFGERLTGITEGDGVAKERAPS